VATIFNYTLENQIAKFSAVKSVVIACLEIGVLGPLYFIVYATVSENIVFFIEARGSCAWSGLCRAQNNIVSHAFVDSELLCAVRCLLVAIISHL